MRTFSAAFRAALEASATDEVPLWFVTLDHPDIGQPLRVVSDVVDYMRGGLRWTGFPLSLRILTDIDRAPRARLTVQNVDQRIGRAVRLLTSAPRLTIELLTLSDFSATLSGDPPARTEIGTATVEYAARHLSLRNVEVTAAAVSGDIEGVDLVGEPWPRLRCTADLCPALFR